MGLLDKYLEQYDFTRYMVAKANDVSASKLQRAAAYDDVEGITTRVILYVAKALNKTPGTVLDEMIELSKK